MRLRIRGVMLTIMLSWGLDRDTLSVFVSFFHEEAVAHDVCRKATVAEHCDTHQLTVTSTGCQTRIYEHRAESLRIAAWCAVNRSLVANICHGWNEDRFISLVVGGGEEEKCVQGVGGETCGKETTWKTPGIDGRTIRWIFRKWDVGVWLDRAGSG